MMTASPLPTAEHANIELKARLASLEQSRETAKRLATDRLDDQHQTDTYFRCRQGRLKLREIRGVRAELIWYQREDLADPKPSRYTILPIASPVDVKRALSAVMGTRSVVEKYRQIFLYHNVRIHLDTVKDLGDFLEFEAVLGEDVDAERGQTQVDFLRTEFALSDSDLVRGSYAELIAAAAPG